MIVEVQTDAADYVIDVEYFAGVPAKLDGPPEDCCPAEPPEVGEWEVVNAVEHQPDCLKYDTEEAMLGHIEDAIAEKLGEH